MPVIDQNAINNFHHSVYVIMTHFQKSNKTIKCDLIMTYEELQLLPFVRIIRKY